MKTTWLASLAVVALGGPAFAQSPGVTTWQIDPSHTAAHFTVRHMMVSNVRGELSGVSGRIILDEKDPSKSVIEAKLPVSTISTREPKRDEHLQSPEFFDVAKFPNITFKSTSVKKAGKDKLVVKGDLTIHGVTRTVELKVELSGEAKDPWGGVRRGAVATTKVDRKDFGLTWNKAIETGGVVISDEVAIELDVEATRVVEQPVAASASKK